MDALRAHYHISTCLSHVRLTLLFSRTVPATSPHSTGSILEGWSVTGSNLKPVQRACKILPQRHMPMMDVSSHFVFFLIPSQPWNLGPTHSLVVYPGGKHWNSTHDKIEKLGFIFGIWSLTWWERWRNTKLTWIGTISYITLGWLGEWPQGQFTLALTWYNCRKTLVGYLYITIYGS